MAVETLPLVTQEILDICPRLRVLVVGKSGVGKSSLISFAFGVDMKSIAHGTRGVCDINTEIISPDNPRFVLHDSMGFEAGETQNFDKVKRFLTARSEKDILLKDRVHIIWLCIQVPASGGRVFETGDELLLELASTLNVPVVAVFTQYDKLYNKFLRLRKNTPKDKIQELCMQQTQAEFHRVCVEPLHVVNPTLRYGRTSGLSGGKSAKPDWTLLDGLVQLTRELVEASVAGDAWIVSTMAQRASVQAKITGAIAVGMKRYWEGIGTGTNFTGINLEKCLDTVHKEMTDSWNFHDTSDLLQRPQFRAKIREFAQLVTPEVAEAKSLFPNFDQIQTVIGIAAGAAVAAAVAPAVVAIGLTAWFISFIAGMYRNTPETLRCFMGYIVDLTLVLDQLFLITLARASHPLTAEEIDLAFESYTNAELGRVHREIRQFANNATFAQIVKGDAVGKKMTELIWEYSSLRLNNDA